jgi:hypothetical protein
MPSGVITNVTQTSRDRVFFANRDAFVDAAERSSRGRLNPIGSGRELVATEDRHG